MLPAIGLDGETRYRPMAASHRHRRSDRSAESASHKRQDCLSIRVEPEMEGPGVGRGKRGAPGPFLAKRYRFG